MDLPTKKERKVITFVNRKGGVSKTTSCAYTAMCLYEAGQSVTGIDTDPDKSWLKWYEAGVLPYQVVEGDKQKLSQQVKGIEDFVVIDTPPNDGEIIYKAASVADEVIVPLAATALDINRLATTLNAVADVEEMRGKPLASVLLTKWQENLVISREVQEALSEQEAPLLDARIRSLTRYQGFNTPNYLREYDKVLEELEVL